MARFRDEDIDGLVITVSDMRLAGHCPSGIKKWLDDNGFDTRKVFKEGVAARDAIAIGDAYAVQVIERTLRNREVL